MYPRPQTFQPTAADFALPRAPFHQVCDLLPNTDYIARKLDQVVPTTSLLNVRFRDSFDLAERAGVHRAGVVKDGDIFKAEEYWIANALLTWMRSVDKVEFMALRFFCEFPDKTIFFPIVQPQRRGRSDKGFHCIWQQIDWEKVVVPGQWTMRVDDLLVTPMRQASLRGILG